MAKYSFKFQLKIVQEYIEGKDGYRFLANKHGIKSSGRYAIGLKSIQNLGKKDYIESDKIKNILFNSNYS